MKKVVTVLLVVVTVLSLAACAGGNEPSGGISAAPPQRITLTSMPITVSIAYFFLHTSFKSSFCIANVKLFIFRPFFRVFFQGNNPPSKVVCP